jgi:hypothetical protein
MSKPVEVPVDAEFRAKIQDHGFIELLFGLEVLVKRKLRDLAALRHVFE